MRISVRRSATGACTPGPFVELPVLGPSDRARCAGQGGRYVHESAAVHQEQLRQVRPVTCRISSTSAPPCCRSMTLCKNVYDPYAFVRDAYLAHRAYLIHRQRGRGAAGRPGCGHARRSPGIPATGNARDPASPSQPEPTPEKQPTSRRQPPPPQSSAETAQPAVSNSSTSLKRASWCSCEGTFS